MDIVLSFASRAVFVVLPKRIGKKRGEGGREKRGG